MNRVKTGFLFGAPSFASGAARVLDLWGGFDGYNESESEQEADAKALAADWLVVGDEIHCAIDRSHDLVEDATR